MNDGECPICLNIMSNDDLTTNKCLTCKNAICLYCYNKTAEYNTVKDAFLNKCCLCRTDNEKLPDTFDKKQIIYLFKSSYEDTRDYIDRLHKTITLYRDDIELIRQHYDIQCVEKATLIDNVLTKISAIIDKKPAYNTKRTTRKTVRVDELFSLMIELNK